MKFFMLKSLGLTFVCVNLINCSKPSITSEPLLPPSLPNKTSSEEWPAYSEKNLAGSVLGKDWQALSASAKVENNNKLIVSIYGEEIKDACGATSLFSSKPKVSLVLPYPLEVKEYSFDTLSMSGNGNPATFSEVGNNVMAEKTKVKVNKTQGAIISLSLYSYGRDVNGIESVINGNIEVLNCSAIELVDFKEWVDLIGYYKLDSFDGVKQDGRISMISDAGGKKYFDRKTEKWLSAVHFPLYQSISGNTATKLNLGPINGLGTTIKNVQDGITTMTYSYNGPVYVNGVGDVTLILSISVTKKDNELNINYVAEVTNYINKTSHQFTLVQ